MEALSHPTDGSREDELRKLVGLVVDERYRITELLGTGGMGAVYEAEHLGLGRKVAIKLINREYAGEGSIASRFAREARAASSIESEHIVSVHDAGSSEGRPYLVMELLRGEDLGRRLRRCGTLSVAETLHIAAQALRGLADAHEAGIVHRDLKPDNLFLVSRKSDRSFVKIVDFGMSKIERGAQGALGVTQAFVTRAGTIIGTPLYMSPEQAQAAADVDVRSDLYSLGAIVFECITGRPPHVGEGYEQVILSICMNDAPDLRSLAPHASPEVGRLVERALRRDRARRFVSARQMLVAVTTLPGYGETAGAAAPAVAPVRDAGPGDVEYEPIAGKTLLAGGAAEPVRAPTVRIAPSPVGTASKHEPLRTVLMSPAPAMDLPDPPSEPPASTGGAGATEATGTQAEWSTGSRAASSPAAAVAAEKLPPRKASLIATGVLVTVAGALLTIWALPRLLVPSPTASPASAVSAAPPAEPAAPESPAAEATDATSPSPAPDATPLNP